MDRRSFLRLTGAATVAGVTAAQLGDVPWAGAAAAAPFAHGVASGDPRADRVLIWTRVTPTAGALPGSGRGPEVTVRWRVALDPGFTRVVASGRVRTGAAVDHTVKVDVTGLAPATWYWYRFDLAGVPSPVGRTRTAPAAGAAVADLRLGLVSCANWEAGYFSAYRHLAARNDLDLVVHVGDYLYEYGTGSYPATPVRRHEPAHEIVTLSDYRRRHGQYKTDPDLQLLHAAYPWATTWDDHESANDAWRGGAENHDPATEGAWKARRRAAYQAYLEWMPVRAPLDRIRLYRRLRFGALADLLLLDLRSHRDQQVGGTDPALADPARTITGPEQMAWIEEQLAASQATWQLLGTSVMVSPVLFPPLPELLGRQLSDVTGLLPEDGIPYNPDQWDGYQAERDRLTDHIRALGLTNVAFLTGDIHTSWGCDVPLDAGTYLGTPTVASPSAGVEIVCPSITSDNLDEITSSPPRTTSLAVETAMRAANRHVKLVELDSHGYTVVDLTPDRLRADWWFTSDRTDPRAGEAFAYGYVAAAGSSTLVPAAGSLASRAVSHPPLPPVAAPAP